MTMNFFKALDVYHKHWGKDQARKKLANYSKDKLNTVIHHVFEENIRDIQDDELPHLRREYMLYLLFELEEEVQGIYPVPHEFRIRKGVLTNYIKNLTENLLSHYGMEYEKTKLYHTETILKRLNVLKSFHASLTIHINRDLSGYENDNSYMERKMLDNIRSVDAIICLF